MRLKLWCILCRNLCKSTGDFTAIYPATNAQGIDNSVSGNSATFYIPATQNYQLNSFDEKAMPMTAKSTDQTLRFKNVFGGICFPLVGDGITVKRIELIADANDVLWGQYTTDIDSEGKPVSGSGVMSNNDVNKHIVTLNCGDGIVLNNTTPKNFYIMLPPGSLANGFTIALYDGDTKLDEMSTTTNPNNCRSIISFVDHHLNVYSKAIVNSNPGVILFPDSYIHPTGVSVPTQINMPDVNSDVNTFNGNDWIVMENAGCVFLPANGWRGGTIVSNMNVTPLIVGNYWSSTYSTEENAYGLTFNDQIGSSPAILQVDGIRTELFAFVKKYRESAILQVDGIRTRYNGFGVRLVRDIPYAP